jgi:hypothetical protein
LRIFQTAADKYAGIGTVSEIIGELAHDHLELVVCECSRRRKRWVSHIHGGPHQDS